jgi:hypothetical protein
MLVVTRSRRVTSSRTESWARAVVSLAGQRAARPPSLRKARSASVGAMAAARW